MPTPRSAHRAAALLALVLAPVLAAPCHAADPGENLVRAWDFTEAADPLGWEPLQGVAPLRVDGGALRVRTVGDDPYIASPAIGATIPRGLLIRVTLRATAAGGAEFFWAAAPTGEEARFRAGDEIHFALAAGPEWQTVTLAPTWRPGDRLERLRFDAPEGKGQTVEIQRIEIVERPVPAGLPPVPQWDFTEEPLALAFLPGPGIEHAYGREGALVCELGAELATLYSPPFRHETAEAGICTLDIRASRPASLDLQFRREGLPLWPPAECVRVPLPASTEFRSVNVDLRGHKSYRGIIEQLALRISAPRDTVLELRGLRIASAPSGPALLDLVGCAPPAVVSALGPSLEITATVANRGGTGSLESELTGTVEPPTVAEGEPVRVPVPALRPLEATTVRLSLPLRRDFAGGDLAARVRLAGSPEQVARTTAVPIPSPALLGGTPGRLVDAFFDETGQAVLRNGLVSLVFPSGGGLFGAGVLYDTTKPDPVRLGSFPSLGRLETGEGVLALRTAIHPAAVAGPTSAELLFRVSVRAGETERAGLARFVLAAGKPDVLCELRLDAGAALPASGLVFPDFLAGDGGPGVDREIAVFPGLEYLLAGERSSGIENVAPPGNSRIAPHPYRCTVPAMWVTSGETTVALQWDPLQEWTTGERSPTPVFSSPDALTGASAHRMGLLAPGALSGRENVLAAADMPGVGPGPVRLAATVFVVHGRDVEPPIRHALERMGGSEKAAPPALPPESPALGDILECAAVGLAETLWIPDQRLWHPNLPDAHGPLYSADFADALWCYSRGYTERPYAAPCEAVLRQAVEAQRERGGSVGVGIAMHEGGLLAELRRRIAQGHSLAQRVRPDGSVAFVPGTPLRASFGIEGDSSSGETGSVAFALLQIAAETRDPEALRAGLAALEYLETQTRPEGAQVWELPLHVPDILAAAYCVRAFALAHELTGDPTYLGQARTWAFRSLPFLYFWSPPERPIMRYGSIPVFGATHYQSGWFGRIVQWNGLGLAQALLELAPLDDSFDWATVARGILLSGGQQMRPLDPAASPLAEFVPDCGHTGLYPDSYDPVAGSDAYHWCLEASPQALLAGRLLGRGGVPSTTILRDGPACVSVTTVAALGQVLLTEDELALDLSLPATYGAHALVVAGLGAPRSVRAGDRMLVQVPDLDAAPEANCYAYDAEAGLLLVRLGPTEDTVALRVAAQPRGDDR